MSESITMMSREGSSGVFVDEMVCGSSATASYLHSASLKWFNEKPDLQNNMSTLNISES